MANQVAYVPPSEGLSEDQISVLKFKRTGNQSSSIGTDEPSLVKDDGVDAIIRRWETEDECTICCTTLKHEEVPVFEMPNCPH